MSGLFPDPVAPGSVEPALLAKVSELHATVRQWLEDSATAQKNDGIKTTLPYADLMFAFGFATLGDHATARRFVDAARPMMEVSIPAGGSERADEKVVAALVSNFLFKAFQDRIEHAQAGRPHAGPLSAPLQADVDQIKTMGNSGPANNPHKFAEYVIGRFCEQYRIVEPGGGPDPYAGWTKHGDALKKALAQLHTIRDPDQFADRIRTLHVAGVEGKELPEVRFFVLHEALPLAARVGEAFAVELLNLVPEALAGRLGRVKESPDTPKKYSELLQRALLLAAHFGRKDYMASLTNEFARLVHDTAGEVRCGLINSAAVGYIGCLNASGMSKEINWLLNELSATMPRDTSLDDTRPTCAVELERWASLLRARLSLAIGPLLLGRNERADPVLARARGELFNTDPVGLNPKEYTALTRLYVVALAAGRRDGALDEIRELFASLPPKKITNTWKTAPFYSRFHLNLVEDTVAAVCRMLAEPTPHVVGDSVP